MKYLDKEFTEYWKDQGIARHKIVRYTSQQNDVVERMNMTILKRVRCMMEYEKLGKHFWGEAVSTTMYLINRSPSTPLDLKTPKEVWSGRMANYINLKIFECSMYVHVSEGKLETRSNKCIFLG